MRSPSPENLLHLLPVPPQTPRPGYRRFVLRGDATQPITAIAPNAPGDDFLLREPIAPLTFEQPFRLKILHFNDFHGHLSRLTAAGEIPVFSRFVAYRRALQQKYAQQDQAAVLMFAGGDDVVGSPLDLLMPEHYPYDLYQAAGVDLGVIGNHDLDFGIPQLAQVLERAVHLPILSANWRSPTRLQPLVYPAALLEVKGVRIGVIGLTTSAQMKGDEAKGFVDPLVVVNHLLPVLRPQCHVLLILSHLGYDLASDNAVVEGYGDRQLAAQLPYGAVDAIIGGHTHDILNEAGLSPHNLVNGIPILQAGAMGRFLGEVTITLQAGQRATVTHAKLIPTADLPFDQPFEQQFIAPLLTSLRNKLKQPLGQVEAHPDLVADVVLNDFASRELAIANFITAGMLAQVQERGFQADGAMTDAAIVRTGLPCPTLRYADWFTLMPYADTLMLFELTGAQLWQLLLDNARRANHPGEPHLERGFMQFSREIRYTILRGNNRQQTQIIEVFVGDRPLQEQLTKTFTLVSHSFLRQLALPWEKHSATVSETKDLDLLKLDRLPSKNTGLFLREELIHYIQAQGGVFAAGGLITDHRLQIVDEMT